MIRVQPMTRLRKVLLGAWCVASAAMLSVPLTMTGGWIFAAQVLILILALGSVGVGIATMTSVKEDVAREEQEFLDTYGSLDDARAVLDLDTLRTVRDTRGVAQAVLIVRREHPRIPLAHAAEIVRGL